MKLSIVVVGWHFKDREIYKKLIEEAKYHSNLKINYYIASHKKKEEIDKGILDYLDKLRWRLLYFKNEGWEWGAFQQFLIWQKNNESLSDYYLFLHDDIKILNHGFIEAFLKKINEGVKVVGNGLKKNPKTSRKITYPQVISWSKIKGFPIKADLWKCVRGSCFFTIEDVVENILMKMPIKKGSHVGFGNWSVIIFGGLVTDKYGIDSVDYIGNKERESFYIKEEYRGKLEKYNVKELVNKAKKILPILLKNSVKRKMPSSPPGLKLNLGCGNKYVEGYSNIDINSECADIKKDILDLEFEKESVSEVLMVHVLEHIDYFTVKNYLKRIYFWLKRDGQVILEFPDVIKVAKCVLGLQKDIEKLQTSAFGIRGFYGEPTKDMAVYDYHKWGWSGNTVKFLLKEIGFKKIYIERPQHHGGHNKRDTRIIAIK